MIKYPKVYSYAVYSLFEYLKNFYNIDCKYYVSNENRNKYLINFKYKDFDFKLDVDAFDNGFQIKMKVDIYKDNQFIKSFKYEHKEYLFNLLAYICIGY